jgi:hypothetical protein
MDEDSILDPASLSARLAAAGAPSVPLTLAAIYLSFAEAKTPVWAVEGG